MTVEGAERTPAPMVRDRTRLVPVGDHWLFSLGALAVAVVGFSLSTSVLLPVLPAVQERFDTSIAASSWVITVYMLVAAVANPIVGRLGDMFGRRQTLLIALGCLAVGALGATFASSVVAFIACRAVQGIAGAVLPLSFGIVRDQVPESRRPVAIATIGAMTAVGGGVGMPLGGLLVAHGSVDLVLWVVFALAVTALVVAAVFVPESGHRAPGRLDVPGALMLAVAVVSPLLGVALGASRGWTQPWTASLIVVGVVSGVVWWRYEAQHASPLVDVHVLRRRPVALTNLVTILMAISLFGAFTLVPVLVQRAPANGGLGLDAGAAGLLMLPCAALTFMTAPLVGSVIRTWGATTPLALSCFTVALGLVLIGVADTGAPQLAVLSGLLGLGFGALNASVPNLIVACVREEETGAQTGVTQMVQNFGTSLGSQLAVVPLVVLAAHGARIGSQVSLGFCAGSMLCAGIAALAIKVQVIPRVPSKRQQHHGDSRPWAPARASFSSKETE